MKILLKSLAVAAALGSCLSAAIPAGAETLADARAEGMMKVGMINEPPYSFMTLSGEAKGIGPEVVEAVLHKLGITEIEWIVTPFNALIPGLNAGRWDVVAAQQSITAQRCSQVAFSNPTNTGLEALLVPEGNPKDIHSYDDLVKDSGLVVATPSGTTELSYLQEYGIPDSRILLISNQADGPEAVRSGRADAYTLEEASGALLMTSGRGRGLELAAPFEIPVIDGKQVIGYGAATFRMDDAEFLDAYNAALAEFVKTDAFWAIQDSNGFSRDGVELALAKTAQQVCAE